MTLATLVAAAFLPTWGSLEAGYKVPEWYEDAKFGIFCHWGVQCAAEAGDWYARNMYGDPKKGQAKHHREHYGDPREFGFKDFIPRWKAEKWNPDELCALYRKMGARYIVAMANHHDNFDNWDSPHQPWNSVNMGPKRDILGEWSKAAAANGLRFGASFHASHAWTWYEPARDYDGLLTAADGKGKWWEGYDPQQLYCQNHAPSANYKDLGSMWRRWDWGAGASLPSAEFVANVKARMMDAIAKYKPDVIYFDDTVLPFWPLEDGRVGLEVVSDFYNENMKWHGGKLEAVATGKILNESQRRAIVWDVERGTPQKPMSPHWQTCSCIGVWHYDRGVYERNRYKDAKTVLRILADVVSKNGNLLLSIPIRGDGSIDEKERAVCEDIAAWMAVNGEAIFGTVPWKVCGEGPQLAATPPLNGPGFNEGRIPRPTEKDVRYTASKKGETVYAIALVPPADGALPECAELAKDGFKVAARLPQVKDMPSVWKFTKE